MAMEVRPKRNILEGLPLLRERYYYLKVMTSGEAMRAKRTM